MVDAICEVPLVVGWDIGGAHLKAARLDGRGQLTDVRQLACPLWQGLEHLEAACDAVLAKLPDQPALHAVTMTGEMADLFADRASGVIALVAFMNDLLARRRPGDTLRIFAGRGGFLAANEVVGGAAGNTELIASANWLATALRCTQARGDGILVDIGSTTSDLICFSGNHVLALGASDRQRLVHGELVYAGIVRTPLMALAQRVPFAGSWRGTMNEHFATTADVFRILGELDELGEAADSQPTADGGPKTQEASARRLLRMVAEDLADADMVSIGNLARYYRQQLLDLIANGLALRLSRRDVAANAPLIGAGVGRFLVADLATRLQRPHLAIDNLLCPATIDPALRTLAADCAPAVAVAQLLLAAPR